MRANLKHGICPYQRHGHKKNWLYPSSEGQSQWRHQQTYWTTTQAHTLWFELAHHNIHTVCDLLEHEKTDSAETELQNPHDSGKQKDTQEEYSIDGVSKPRDLETDQQLITTNNGK